MHDGFGPERLLRSISIRTVVMIKLWIQSTIYKLQGLGTDVLLITEATLIESTGVLKHKQAWEKRRIQQDLLSRPALYG